MLSSGASETVIFLLLLGIYSIMKDRRSGNNPSTKLHNLRSLILGRALTNVRSWRKSGRHLLMPSVSQFGNPGQEHWAARQPEQQAA